MDALLILGALAWCIASLIGMAVVGDGPVQLDLFLASVAVLVAVMVRAVLVPRRVRWRGDVRPRETARPPFAPYQPLKPAQVRVEERWGVTKRIGDSAWVREVGRLSWRGATVFLVGDGTGLVIDPWFWSRRPYVFDDTCRVAPSPTPATLNPGLGLRRKNGVLRVSQGTRVVDLAVPVKYLSAVALVGASQLADEPAAMATPTAAPIARIARTDRRAARRHEFFARINAKSKTNGWVAVACALFYFALGAGGFLALAQMGQLGAALFLPVMECLAAAGVYALRVVIQENPEPSADEGRGD